MDAHEKGPKVTRCQSTSLPSASAFYQPGKLAFATASAAFIIVRQLPVEGPKLRYRIKSSAEAFEWVASGNQLSRRSN